MNRIGRRAQTPLAVPVTRSILPTSHEASIAVFPPVVLTAQLIKSTTVFDRRDEPVRLSDPVYRVSLTARVWLHPLRVPV